jgi:hypothetical protein
MSITTFCYSREGPQYIWHLILFCNKKEWVEGETATFLDTATSLLMANKSKFRLVYHFFHSNMTLAVWRIALSGTHPFTIAGEDLYTITSNLVLSIAEKIRWFVENSICIINTFLITCSTFKLPGCHRGMCGKQATAYILINGLHPLATIFF